MAPPSMADPSSSSRCFFLHFHFGTPCVQKPRSLRDVRSPFVRPIRRWERMVDEGLLLWFMRALLSVW